MLTSGFYLPAARLKFISMFRLNLGTEFKLALCLAIFLCASRAHLPCWHHCGFFRPVRATVTTVAFQFVYCAGGTVVSGRRVQHSVRGGGFLCDGGMLEATGSA